MGSSPNIEPRPVAYSVSALPEDDPNHSVFEIKVERTHHTGTWAIRWMGRCLSVAGDWDFEPTPSSRDDEWLVDHRFGLADALAEAVIAAPNLVVNDMTPAASLARSNRKG